VRFIALLRGKVQSSPATTHMTDHAHEPYATFMDSTHLQKKEKRKESYKGPLLKKYIYTKD
jgi:hypothetical protein